MFKNRVDTSPHIVLDIEFCDGGILTYIPETKMFCCCELYSKKNRIKFKNMTLMESIKFLLNYSSEIQFKFPLTWESKKKGRLHYLLDPSIWSDERVKELLLMLLL